MRRAAARWAAAVRERASEARYVPPENYHVTMKFLGHVAGDAIEDMMAATAQAAKAAVPFEASVGRAGAFPSARRARVVWLGVADPSNGFRTLARACDEAFVPLGFRPEQREFVPHLTLARLRVPAPVELPDEGAEGVAFRVGALTLFQSLLRRPAPRYEAVRAYPLGA